MLFLPAIGIILQIAASETSAAELADTVRGRVPAAGRLDSAPPLRSTIERFRFADLTTAPLADTLRRRRPKAFEYSEGYSTRVGIHKALSWAMIPLFIGSGYTGFRLKKETTGAPEWVRKLHGPLAGATAVVFGMNTLTGVWNLIEGRKDPVDRGKRFLHGALFLAATGGFVYVITAGDNIHELGKANHWHRDVALASMGVSVFSWAIMTF